MNLVSVRMKSGEIRLCVDLWNLNKASDKANYPVLPMEQILKMVSGSKLFSLLDGFFGLNQVLFFEQDQLKNTFHTKCRTFTYKIMPFDLMNSRATFQRAMDIAFQGLVGHFVVIYLDDVRVFLKK